MDKSVFTEKSVTPDNGSLSAVLGNVYPLWNRLVDYVHLKYPATLDEWNYSGDKYGWSFRIKDKKRVIIYLLPRNQYFKVAFVFGQKATDSVMKSQISEEIKKELESARVFAEGRGIRIDVRDETIITNIESLIDIKINK